jgi:Zn-dependent peptidase ImmA (M78 family)
MHFLAEKISKLKIGWNERALTEDDLYRICRRFKVSVIEEPLSTRGFYYRLAGRDFITIDSRLSGTNRLAVLFHELGHFLLHVPETGPAANFHRVGRRTRKEIEADVFALCALIPHTIIESRRIDELAADGTYPADLIAARHKIYIDHRL